MPLTRRRFLVIAAGLPLVSAKRGYSATDELYEWRGVALGADAVIRLIHPQAPDLVSAAVAEIRRLEQVFSLYDAQSALCQLNRDRRLTAPPVELLAVLALSGQVHAASDGAFDPTVQPLWQEYAKAWAKGAAPSDDVLIDAQELVGFARVSYSEEEILLQPGMALTLNGIAQGQIADRVVALLGTAGVQNVLVDAGEIATLGRAPDGGEWPVKIAGSRRVGLSNRALATSAPLGTAFDPEGRVSHILDPRSGKPAARIWRQISISAGSAAVADALSTAACLLPDDTSIRHLLSKFDHAVLVDLQSA
ncbi:FAD:protein FMN transferase [Tabrizicola sp. J26]|uniref:FAD:protein FMN transferase n=1 Tax=Alitabrizicola rongguiensis TaxID=2909234 RepID=UPI001F15EAFD|nr:FAD:protein FMN transferase [Tabrizicola rongguiensis]MCF1711148.1 FAD:protein FMN transferase [Tabrizicola rongguiensis]